MAAARVMPKCTPFGLTAAIVSSFGRDPCQGQCLLLFSWKADMGSASLAVEKPSLFERFKNNLLWLIGWQPYKAKLGMQCFVMCRALFV